MPEDIVRPGDQTGQTARVSAEHREDLRDRATPALTRARSAHLRSIVIVTIILVPVSFGITLLLDQTSFLSEQQFTAGLLVGLLAMPVNYLIVNLAAERVIRSFSERSWAKVRTSEAEDLLRTWSGLRRPFKKVFSIMGPDYYGGANAQLLDSLSSRITETAINANSNDTVGKKELHPQLVADITHVADNLKYLEQSTVRSDCMRMREQLLPRIEASAQDNPDAVRLVRLSMDALSDFEAKWGQLSPPESWKRLTSDWTKTQLILPNLSLADARSIILFLGRLRLLNMAAGSVASQVDVLMVYLEERPPQ